MKTGQPREGRARILYTDEAAALPKERTFQFLTDCAHVGNVTWREIQPTARQVWLTEGLRPEFDTFIPMGTKAAKATKGDVKGTIFNTFSLGVITARDAWAYHFKEAALRENMTRLIEFYNAEVGRWERRADRQLSVNDFVNTDRRKIKWTDRLKAAVEKGTQVEFSPEKIRLSLYRPFTKSHLYFDRLMNQRVYVFPSIFPTPETEQENRVICVSGIASTKPFQVLMADVMPNNALLQLTQCFPFYTYDEDGTNRRENITDWALSQFRAHYADDTITKWDIFHYNYAVLHHPEYRETYQVNLKHDLPHIPFAPDFWRFVEIGRALADMHVNYETLDVMPKVVETPPLNWRVEKMALSKDKTSLRYNESLTVTDIPAEVFDYRLGTRSALEWIIDRYRVKPDPNGSGIIADPNVEDAQYVVRLVGQVMHVSQETVRLVGELPPLFP